MSDPLPDNLAILYSGFGEEVIDAMFPGDSFVVDGVEFVCRYAVGSTPSRFYIVKNLELVDRYRKLCERFVGASIVELGIAEGGSTALLALLAQPRKLVAVDLESRPASALAEFIDARDLAELIQPHYGVDQADRTRLAELVDSDFDGEPLDLVIDDCSHQFGPTRSSFETLFPRLRPNGLYVIEDWNADHVWRDAIGAALADTTAPDHEALVRQFRDRRADPEQDDVYAQRDPLTRLALELVVARCSLTPAIAEVTLDEFWIVVRRGTAELDPATFRLDDHYTDHFGFVPPRRGTEA